jgi:hypothetical protein
MTRHDTRAHTDVEVGLLAAEREPAMLFELARNRLERVSIPKPVVALRLLARELPPFVPASARPVRRACRSSNCRGRNCANACARAWATRRCTAWRRPAIRARNAPGDACWATAGASTGACASTTPDLAAAAAGAAARSAPAHRVRPRAAGKRLVGWRGRTPRLLRAGNRAGPARLGVRAAG